MYYVHNKLMQRILSVAVYNSNNNNEVCNNCLHENFLTLIC